MARNYPPFNILVTKRQIDILIKVEVDGFRNKVHLKNIQEDKIYDIDMNY